LCKENSQNSETRALTKKPVARLLVERYKMRHLAAQVRSANGLRGIFKFSEILGRTSYIQDFSEQTSRKETIGKTYTYKGWPLKWMLKKQDKIWTGFILLRIGTSGSLVWSQYWGLGSTKFWEFPDQLRTY